MNSLWVVAWRNIKRKSSRSALLAGSAAIAALLLFVSYFFVFSMERSLKASSQRLGADLLVVPKGVGDHAGDMMIAGKVSAFYMPETVVERIEQIPEVEQAAPQLYLKTVSTVCCGTEGDFPVVAFDPQRDFTLKNWVAETSRSYDKYDVIIGSKAGGGNYLYHYDDDYSVQWVTLFGKEFMIRNVLFPTGMGTDDTIFMRLDAAREMSGNKDLGMDIPKDQISVVLVKTEAGMDEFVKREIERMNLAVDVVKGSGLQEVVNRQIFPIKLFSYLMIMVMIVMSGFQVMTIFSALVNERRKEIGMLRAMGAARVTVYRLLLAEAMLSGLIGSSLGALTGAALLYDNRALILKFLTLPLVFPDWISGFGIGLAVMCAVTGISVLAAFLPVNRMLREQPYQSMREGEV